MSRLRTILFGVVFGILAFFTYRFFFLDNQAIVIEISKEPVLKDVKRVGINLGKWTPWGAAQYMSNVLFNPGFEGGVSRSVVTVEGIKEDTLFQIQAPNLYLNHFWDGATFEVLTGISAGQKGIIVENVRNNEGMTYKIDPKLQLRKNDSIVITQFETGETPINWWVPDKVRYLVTVDSQTARPKSPGTQSALLILDKEETPILSFYLDTLSEKAGNMLPIEGKWKCAFWAKSEGPDVKLRIDFLRHSKEEPTLFLEKEEILGNEWKEYTYLFEGSDPHHTGPLQLMFEGVGDEGKIWLDDVTLSKADENGFRKELIEALKALKPGVIRNWQGQLGDTFANSKASLFGRKPNRYKMAYGDLEFDFLYGLEEFLILCKEVQALPWIVLPSCYTDEELEAFGSYLKRFHFPGLYVEFGNEVWNPLYEAGQPKQALQRAKVAFSILQPMVENLIPILSDPDQDMFNVAISPFFMTKLGAQETEEQILKQLYEPYNLLKNSTKPLLIAETNLHTLGGGASSVERNRVVASKVAGLSLANHVILALQRGVEITSIFKLAGFEFTNTKRTRDLEDAEVRLFGVIRDLGSTGRFRPQGLAIQALNTAVQGNFHPIDTKDKELLGGAFIHNGKLNLVLSSSSPDYKNLRIKLPPKMEYPTKLTQMISKKLFDSNEDSEQVKLHTEALPKIKGDLKIMVPPYGLLILN